MASPVVYVILTTTCLLVSLGGAQAQYQQVNQVENVDIKLKDNVARHHTNSYKQMYTSTSAISSSIGANIVLRRGDTFDMTMTMTRPYQPQTDKIRLELLFGQRPQLDKGTHIYVPVTTNPQSFGDPVRWAALITNQPTSRQLNVQISIPANASVGVWTLKYTTKLAGGHDLRTYTLPQTMYLIFNPWAQQDTVYMAREDARQEYVLTETGKVYMGQYNKPTGTRWLYAQFSEYVLPGMMMVLDKTRLDFKARADVVKVSRAISAAVNSHDDMGLLVGNWSGKYGDGVSPWLWQDSSSIFERYYKSGGRPVKFGQCWVFGGLTTTALRTLGIPARSITNFVSAHDTDLSLTVDQFSSERGDKMSGVNGDSIWNFHVWSDAWMIREDLPREYSGWQAIDATPQETSMGVYQLGPAPLEAIKQGKVNFAYDVGFVYSEVNADVVTWRLDSRSPYHWRRVVTQTDHVGRKILTKAIGKLDAGRYGINDAEDITAQYKYREGSKEERASYNEAFKLAGLEHLLSNS